MLSEAVQATMRKADTWALRGTIVTMNKNQDVIDDGLVIVNQGKIVSVTVSPKLPSAFADAEIINTAGVIYPGLIDLHNHLAYNMMPLWAVPEQYKVRDQWRAYPRYKSDVYQPVSEVLSVYPAAARASARFIEAKALMGGVCTGQGIGKRTKAGNALLIGAMRNVEMPLADNLPSAGGSLMDIHADEDGIKNMRHTLENPKLKAYLYHLAEGTNDTARNYYLRLRDNDLINEKLVGIHALGLTADDLLYMAGKGAKVVWSPYSNLLLYGKTLDLNALKKSNLLFSIGCDWSPSGSKNLLQEAKIAWQVNLDQGSPFTNRDIVNALTGAPAKILGWDSALGTIETGKLADLLVLENKDANVYQNLIMATEPAIRLVLIDGIARFGEAEIMAHFPVEPGYAMEDIICGKTRKKLYLYHPQSELNKLSFNQARQDLKTIMKDLKAFTDANPIPKTTVSKEFFALEADHFQLLIDEDMAPISTTEKFLTAPPPRKNSIELDEVFPFDGNYLNEVAAELNLPASIKAFLKKCYS